MLKPVYVPATVGSHQSGWYIADESGALLPDGHAFADKAACYRAIASLTR